MYYSVVALKKFGKQAGSLTYSYSHDLSIGQLVKVPFGPNKVYGVIVGSGEKGNFTVKPIDQALPISPLPKHLIELAAWMQEYYACPPADVWQSILPTGFWRKRRPQEAETIQQPARNSFTLNSSQQLAARSIEESSKRTHLLEGVAGAGKTEVYFSLAKKELSKGHSVIILVPEIALTVQMIARLRSNFAVPILVNHSGLSEAARHKVWATALEAKSPVIVVGPRSSLFMPLAKIGLIVIDESHENTYKQEQSPRYQAASVAATLAKFTDAKLVLGTATPAISDWYLSSKDIIHRTSLPDKFGSAGQNVIRVIDMKDRTNFRRSPIFSDQLIEAMQQALDANRQSLLFINRRGSASSVVCASCAYILSCPKCQAPLTFHADLARLICHLCNWRQVPPAICPSCKQSDWRYTGFGSKRLQTEAARLFPTARIGRLDRDSAKGDLENFYQKSVAGELDILIGTQMLAKGFDLPKLDKVGIVSADTMLHIPDFSAAERTFQLIAQAAGRAGRREDVGAVVIQTFTPEHPAIQAVAQNKPIDFYESELESRKLLNYPPFSYLLKLTIGRKSREVAEKQAMMLASSLASRRELIVMGPAPAFREIAGGSFYWHLIIKSPQRKKLVEIAKNLPADWTFDLDPITTL